MLGTSLALSPDVPTSVATNGVTYVLRAADLGRSEYSVAGLALPTERKLLVSHDTGKSGEQRSMIRIDKTEVDSLGVAATGSVYLVVVRPPNTAITNALLIASLNSLLNLLAVSANGNFTALLNREV